MLSEEVDINAIFPLMIFQDDEEKICREYMKSRGIFLYKQVYDALVNWIGGTEQIKYKQFANLIRYDKGIRDKLYIYLSAAEEYLRNIIFDELEIDILPENTSEVALNINDLRRRLKTESNNKSNLYYYSYSKNFNFGLIEQIFEKFGLAVKYDLNQSDLSEIRKLLRNKVMHHNMLLLSCFTERAEIENEIKEIETGIEALYRVLPTIELREGSVKDGVQCGGLTLAINRSNYPDGDITKEPFDNLICLHKFKAGRFIR